MRGYHDECYEGEKERPIKATVASTETEKGLGENDTFSI